MTDAEELAERYLALWTQYLTALLADPRTMDMLKRWTAFAGQFSYPAQETNQTATNQPGAAQPGGAGPFPAWPPFFSPFGMPAPPGDTGGAARRDDELAQLSRRVDALERRLAALEPAAKPGTARPRRRR